VGEGQDDHDRVAGHLQDRAEDLAEDRVRQRQQADRAEPPPSDHPVVQAQVVEEADVLYRRVRTTSRSRRA